MSEVLIGGTGASASEDVAKLSVPSSAVVIDSKADEPKGADNGDKKPLGNAEKHPGFAGQEPEPAKQDSASGIFKKKMKTKLPTLPFCILLMTRCTTSLRTR